MRIILVNGKILSFPNKIKKKIMDNTFYLYLGQNFEKITSLEQ